MTKTEADLLEQLGDQRGHLGLWEFRHVASTDGEDPGLARRVADAYFPRIDDAGFDVEGGEDGHNDAFRYACWNALMTNRFGEGFAAAFAIAHEGLPDNPAAREAMVLFNNELGRRLAQENPGAGDLELAELTYEGVTNGEAIVVDPQGSLADSDRVAYGATGRPAANFVLEGVIDQPDHTASN